MFRRGISLALGAVAWLALMVGWGIAQDLSAQIALTYLIGFARGFLGGYLSTPGGFTLTAIAAFAGLIVYRRRG